MKFEHRKPWFSRIYQIYILSRDRTISLHVYTHKYRIVQTKKKILDNHEQFSYFSPITKT